MIQGRVGAVVVALVIAVLCVLGYATLIEPRRVTRTFVRVVMPELTLSSRYLVLADTHLTLCCDEEFRRIAHASEWASAEGARAALLLGDILERDNQAEFVAERLARALQPLAPIYVSGNHEMDQSSRVHWPLPKNDHAKIAAALERHGFISANKRVVEGAGGLRFLGLPWQGWRIGPDPEALRLFEQVDGALVLLTHSPDHVVGVPADRVRFALCGHTHGGQVRIPFVGAPWVPTSAHIPADFGLMRLAGIPTFLTRGLGATIPIRLGAPPEVVLVEFAPDRSSRVPLVTVVIEHPAVR